MPSIRGSLDQLQALITVSVASFDRPQDRETCRGLIDTGATRTCITPRLISRFSLPLRAKLLVASAQSHPERRRAYGYSLGFFCEAEGIVGTSSTLHVLPHEMIAPDFRDNDNFDVLVGMDLLSRGRLVFEHGEFEFRF